MRMKAVLFVAGMLALAGCEESGARPKASEAEVAEAVRGNTAFALELYARLAEAKKGRNLFVSPYSISTALGMTCAGARGRTAAQMRKVLRFTLADGKLHPALGALAASLNAAGKAGKFELSTANALWAQKDYPFLPEFLALNARCYGAGLQTADFKNDTEGARKAINAWVGKETRDKIKELLQPGVLDEATRLVLTNAIYFKGDWASRFDEKRTSDAAFKLAGGKQVTVAMMNRVGKFKLFRGGGFQAVELPYAGKRLSMVIFLPDKVDGLAALEKTLNEQNLSRWLSALDRGSESKGLVQFPRFKVASQFELAKALGAMGMTDAFDMEKADLSGIDGRKWLYISAVIHRAFTEVNEEGSEAAAATAVVVRPANGGGLWFFDGNHPFLFLIRDRKSGSILFMGRLADPRAG